MGPRRSLIRLASEAVGRGRDDLSVLLQAAVLAVTAHRLKRTQWSWCALCGLARQLPALGYMIFSCACSELWCACARLAKSSRALTRSAWLGFGSQVSRQAIVE